MDRKRITTPRNKKKVITFSTVISFTNLITNNNSDRKYNKDNGRDRPRVSGKKYKKGREKDEVILYL